MIFILLFSKGESCQGKSCRPIRIFLFKYQRMKKNDSLSRLVNIATKDINLSVESQ